MRSLCRLIIDKLKQYNLLAFEGTFTCVMRNHIKRQYRLSIDRYLSSIAPVLMGISNVIQCDQFLDLELLFRLRVLLFGFYVLSNYNVNRNILLHYVYLYSLFLLRSNSNNFVHLILKVLSQTKILGTYE